ncbi:Ribonuclease T2 family protein [Panicum miliaceum]|uniref:Ribonuclease T2 family protein n=1 Tax=Panicum miliaceum TaxID=4540 RepID=A0A3L6QNY9_PANMI|nr:Ribonuclease T2 family protein [Panicum miliaceum]
MQWPGAYCEDSDNGCCVPKYGYPAEDFFVESLQTFDLSINKPIVRCRNGKPFEANKLDKIENSINHYWSNLKCPPTDGVNTWKSAWNSYGKLYSTEKIRWAVEQKLGVAPGRQCRDGPFGKKQLYQVYLCVDTDAKTFIKCPKLPATLSCPASVVFHPFYTWMLNSTAASGAGATFESKLLLLTETMLK